MQIIKNGAIVDDAFVHVANGAELPEQGDLIVSLSRYVEERDKLRARAGKVGVRLASDEEASSVEPYLAEVALVAIEFPTFKDGRGYTTARLLRDRYGYKGELRAVGDVLRDQLNAMRRCGFDAYELKAGKDIHGALQAFQEFSVTYQGAADDPRPLFRRRARAAS
jgi:uncharacterized protein (DUF934 family)